MTRTIVQLTFTESEKSIHRKIDSGKINSKIRKVGLRKSISLITKGIILHIFHILDFHIPLDAKKVESPPLKFQIDKVNGSDLENYASNTVYKHDY